MEIRKLPPHPAPTKRLQVAAYVRVSRESERLSHSFSAQVSYYNQLISSTPGWEYAGVYSGLVWFCGPGVLRVVGCYWWCCAHWCAYWLGESQPSALWGCSSL